VNLNTTPKVVMRMQAWFTYLTSPWHGDALRLRSA
jgi:hypothetical protein